MTNCALDLETAWESLLGDGFDANPGECPDPGFRGYVGQMRRVKRAGTLAVVNEILAARGEPTE